MRRLIDEGWALFPGQASAAAARRTLDRLCAGLDPRLALWRQARIPHRSCPDAVETPFIALHFEMGVPLAPVEDSTEVYALAGLYLPRTGPRAGAWTRLLPVRGLCAGPRWGGAAAVERGLRRCARSAADGWGDFNSGRLSCAGRLLDAAAGGRSLGHMREHRISEWFNVDERGVRGDGAAAERRFYARHGLRLSSREQRVRLRPGDLLVIDNLRVAHGRWGRRGAEELWQFLYGFDARPAQVDSLRRALAHELARKA